MIPMTLLLAVLSAASPTPSLTISWENNTLTLHDPRLSALPATHGKIEIWYLEAFCRPGSTDRDWKETTIPHRTDLISKSDDGKQLELKSTLDDGVTVQHIITASDDSVDFQLTAHNPTDKPSDAHWAQPCIRVSPFTGGDQDTYYRNCFVFIDGRLQRMPTPGWSLKARYIPGQVWAAPGVDRNDVNPRPLNPHTPSHPLIGCFSADGKWLLANAWDPYQELFQGVVRCIHSDFRIGGLKPGETKHIHGKIYLLPNDIPALLKRYATDFPPR